MIRLFDKTIWSLAAGIILAGCTAIQPSNNLVSNANLPLCSAVSCPALPNTGEAAAARWGVAADGHTDDASGLNAAFAYSATHNVTILLTGTSRAAATVVIPGGATVKFVGGNAGNPLDGARIVCDLAATPCVAAGEDDFKAATLRSPDIGRAAGAIPPGSIGLKVMGINAVITDPVITNSDTCLQFWETAGPAAASGFLAHVERGFIAGCRSYAIEFVGWALANIRGTYIGAGAFQGSGIYDYDGMSVFHVTGGQTSCPAGGGPNTIEIRDVDAIAFDKADGTQAVYGARWDFSALNNSCDQAAIFTDTGGHSEEVEQLLIGDQSLTVLDDFRYEDSSFVGGQRDMGEACWFAPDLATQIVRTRIARDTVYFWNDVPHSLACLTPTAPIEGLVIGDIFTYGRTDMVQAGPVNLSIAAPAGSWGNIGPIDLKGGGAETLTGPGAGGFLQQSNWQ